jgi:outer membrane receptor protein involved in Fe transport
VAEGGVIASFTRDVGAETAARAARGGGYAGTRELTTQARKQRERGSGRGCGESGRADGRARQGRERRGGKKAHARGGPARPKG